MSHPVINRWGWNLFWYNFWFADKNYSYVLQQDRLLTTFFYIYINFGLLHPNFLFINRYWYANSQLNFNFSLAHNPIYFRFFNTTSDSDDDYGYYRTRVQTPTMYESRIWILRFRGWFFINFYSFHPRETALVKRRIKKIKYSYTNNFVFTPSKLINYFKRFKFILSYLYLQHLNKPQISYLF